MRSCLVGCGLWLMVMPPVGAQQASMQPSGPPQPVAKSAATKDERPPAPPRPSLLRPVGPERFARVPQTPLELWDAADYLVRSGQAKLAVPYLNSFVKANPDNATLIEIRDRFGVGSVLRLSDDPATAPFAQPLLDKMIVAVRTVAAQPERLDTAIELLSHGAAERQIGRERLREAGPYAVGPILQRLAQTGVDDQTRAILADSLGTLDTDAVPALIAALDAPNPTQSTTAARALGQIGDRRALTALVFQAARADAPASLREAAQRSAERLSGRPAPHAGPAAQALADMAWLYHRHRVEFPSERVDLWHWTDTGPAPSTVARADAESELGLARAQEALRLDPKNTSAQLALLSLSLDRAARKHGVAQVVAKDPDGSFAQALSAGAQLLSEVLRTAIADGHMAVAEVATSGVARVTDHNSLWATGTRSPLVEALAAPDRRVQFAAARALIELEPEQSFPGSSRVAPILARFLGSHNARRALVVDANTARASMTASTLKSLGYDTETTTDGRDAFAFASRSAGVELILIDATAVEGPMKWLDLLTNLRADARTADIPTLITGTLKDGDLLRPRFERFARTDYVVTPTDPNLFGRQLNKILERMGARPMSDDERAAYAQEAATLLGRIASRPRGPFAAGLQSIEPALAVALANPASNTAAAAALGDVPGADAQRDLAGLVIDSSQPVASRVAAGQQLVRSIQRFGPLLSNTQEKALVEAAAGNTEPQLRSIMAAVIGALRPAPEVSGQRLQGNSTKPAGAAPTNEH